jgi:hypothetical protein
MLSSIVILLMSVFCCNVMLIPVFCFNVTLILGLNSLGRSLFSKLVLEITGKTWKHSQRFKSCAEQTY